MGISYDDFWEMNPRIFRVYEKSYRSKMEDQDQMNWTLGQYFYAASYSAIGLLFGGKDFKPNFPEKPYSESIAEKVERTKEETEKEKIERQLQAFIRAEEAWIRNERSRGLPESL